MKGPSDPPLTVLGKRQISKEEENKFKEDGFLVIRQFFSKAEIEQLYRPIHQAYVDNRIERSAAYDRPEGTDVDPKLEYRYPMPGNFPLGSRILEDSPEVAPLLASNEAVVSLVERLLGEEARLSQHQVYCRTAGAAGTGASSSKRLGAGTHYDYKPWRPVGSFVKNWLFVIVPFVDYTKKSGPLLVVPGSHKAAEIIPSTNGRTYGFRAPCVPRPQDVAPKLVDPVLKKGDLLLMDGSTWHEAWPNQGSMDRIGIYLKYHAKSSPPAVGPVIHPKKGYDASPITTRHVLNYNIENRYSGICMHEDNIPGPTRIFSEAAVIIEDIDGRIALQINGVAKLPCIQGAEQEIRQYTERQRRGLQYLDAGNLIKPLAIEAKKLIQNAPVTWMSWITDIPSDDGLLCRIYAHKLQKAAKYDENKIRFLSIEEIENLHNIVQGKENVIAWIKAWKSSTDLEGVPVVRGFAYPHGLANRTFQGTYNGAGGTGFGYKNAIKAVPYTFDYPQFAEDGRVLPPTSGIITSSI